MIILLPKDVQNIVLNDPGWAAIDVKDWHLK